MVYYFYQKKALYTIDFFFFFYEYDIASFNSNEAVINEGFGFLAIHLPARKWDYQP